jgi:hypothetical protein
VVFVMYNLNTHNIASLYVAFPPEKARCLVNQLKIHFTPKHGSWLNISEIEFSALKRQRPNRWRRRALLSIQFFCGFKVLPLVMPLIENLLLSRKIHTSFLESGNLRTDGTVSCCRTQNIS